MSKTQFSDSSSKRLVDGFHQLEQNDIEYMILNTWLDLPNASHGSDIDILVHKEHYQTAIDILKNVGFSRGRSSHWRITGFAKLVKKGLTTHRKDAVDMFLNNPVNEMAKKVINPAYAVDGYDPGMVDKTPLYYDNMKLDITNHLNYYTADGSDEMRVNPEVEKYFFNNKVEFNQFYVPNPPCELAHLISRIVFDYEQKTGESIPNYYVDRCNELVETVTEDREYDRIFRTVLKHIYFKADELVYDLVVQQKYEDIRSELTKFSEY